MLDSAPHGLKRCGGVAIPIKRATPTPTHPQERNMIPIGINTGAKMAAAGLLEAEDILPFFICPLFLFF